MAVAAVSRLPRIVGAPDLRDYHLERDQGLPTSPPTPAGFTQTLLPGGMRYDRIEWEYTQKVPPRGLPADGFIVYWAFADTADPDENGVLVPVDQRSFGLVVPNGALVSYAVAAYRHNHIGEQRTAKVQLADWSAVDGSLLSSAQLYEVDLVGTKDGVNVTFTSPVPVLMGTNGKPRALLTWRRARQFYSATNPPPAGRYTLVAGAVVLAEAPQAGDYLAWDTIDVS